MSHPSRSSAASLLAAGTLSGAEGGSVVLSRKREPISIVSSEVRLIVTFWQELDNPSGHMTQRLDRTGPATCEAFRGASRRCRGDGWTSPLGVALPRFAWIKRRAGRDGEAGRGR